MSYWGLNAVFLAAVAAVAVAATVIVLARVRDASARRRVLGAVGITMAVLLAMTAVFDNVMIGVGLVGYEPSLISGAFVGIAPVEDFAYAVAAVLLLPSVWVLLGVRSGAGASDGRGGVGARGGRGARAEDAPRGARSARGARGARAARLEGDR